MALRTLDRVTPVVDDMGRPTQILQLLSEEIARLPIIIGTGSPEGVVEARRGRQYMDDAGTTGTILYIKKLSDIGGDKKQGWILV